MPPVRTGALLVGAARAIASTPAPYVLTGVAAGAFSAAAIAPVASAVSRLLVASTGAYVVANTDLVVFLLRPRGLLVLLVLGVAAGLSAQLVSAAGAAVHGLAGVCKADPGSARSAAWCAVAHTFAALRLIGGRLPALAELAARKVVGVALRAAPFLAVIGVVAALSMRGYDLYYFVKARPTPFWVALVTAVIVGGAGVLVVLRTLARWVLALPMCLFDGVSPVDALRRSRVLMADRTWPVLGAMVAWHMAAAGVGWAVAWAVLAAARPLLDRSWSSMEAAALATGAVVAVASVVSVIGNALGSLGQGVLACSLERGTTPSGSRPEPSGRLVRRPVALMGVAALAAVSSVSAGVAILEGSTDPLSIVIAAHRGASIDAPENTLAAVARAAQLGAPWIEIDVQITRDGGVIVAHDTDLRRIASGDARRVADLTLDEITGVDAGRWFNDRFAGERVPTLGQVIDAAGQRANLFIELKATGDPGPLARATLDVVRSKGFLDRSVFVSLSSKAVEIVRTLEPRARVGLILSAGVGAPERFDASVVLLNEKLASESAIARYKRFGADVYVWTIADPDRLAPLALAGATGVLVDDPGPMLERAKEISEMSEIERIMLTARERLRR